MAEERRLVTVLFADVTGSTALGEELDPEDVRALLSRYYEIAKDVVALHGGTLEKFIGDAAMAIFGLPAAHGDDPARALSAALDLRDRVRADPRLGERLPIRVGVNTGEVVAARSRDADFLVTGDAVNIAARLQQGAEPWGILCGERTARAAGDGFELGPRFDLGAKGKRQPIRALSLLGRATRAPSRVRMPLFGRDADLAQLELVASRAISERRPFLVSLIAPAGTGKTRLLEEFLDRLGAHDPPPKVAIAQCLPYGQRLTYWPLRAVLHRLAGLPEDAEPPTVRERLLEWLRERGVGDPPGVSRLLAATIGAGEGEVTDRSALFAAWRTAVEAATTSSPLVLVFEDLHWSSDSLLDLVEFVMQPHSDTPVLMVTLTRPELLERRPAWGGGRRNHLALTLEPLRDDAVGRIVEHLLEAALPEIVWRVVERAEGNPFYAGELVRGLVERIGPTPDLAAVDDALAKLPDTVQATVLARLDLLKPDERRALQVGAVFGRSFRAQGLAALAPELAGDAERLAGALAEKDLVRPFGADAYAFRHILIREVTYQTLPRAERAALHAAAGRWLEGRAAGRQDALAELIAFHWREAAVLARALEPESTATGDVARSAVRWLRHAAETAAAAAATVEAQRHLRSAIELAPRGELAELYERLASVALYGDGTVAAWKSALALVRELGGSNEQQLRVTGGLLMTYMRLPGGLSKQPTPAELDALRAEGAALVAAARDERVVATYLIAEGFHSFWLSARGDEPSVEQIDAAERSARRGLALAERIGEAPLQSAALDAIGSAAMQRDAWREVREIAIRRMAMAGRVDLTERMDTYSVRTWAAALLGELEEADRISAAGLAQVQPGQVPSFTLHLAVWRTYALALRGKWDEALAAADRAYELWVETERPPFGFALRGFIAGLDVARARSDERRVERCGDAIDGIARESPEDSVARRCRAFLAGCEHVAAAGLITLATVRRRPELAERAIARCSDGGCAVDASVLRPIVARSSELGAAPLEAQARRALGLAAEDPEELARAATMFDTMGAVPYAARARCERGLLVGDAEQLAEGTRELEALGDLEQLARYERRARDHAR